MANYCTKCGKEISENSRFCLGCGAEITTKENIKKKKTNTSSSPSAPQKKTLLLPAVAAVLVIAVIMSLFVWPGFLKSERVTIADGHEVVVPQNALETDTKVMITVLEEGEFFCDEEFEAVDVISLSTENGQTEFNGDIKVRFQLPEDIESEEYFDYVCGYYNGSEWDYILPEGFTFDKGYVEFGTPHFSTFGLFRSSKMSIREMNKAMNLYAERMAYEKLDIEYQKEAIKPAVIEALDSMGINSSEAQGIILQNLLKEGENGDLGSILVGLQNGDPADVTSGLVSSIAKAVLDAEVNDMDMAGTVFGTGTSAVVSAIKSFRETGDYGEAYKDFVWAAMDAIPVTKYSKIAIDINKALINKYNDYSYECLYDDFEEYTNDGSIHDDDWNTICVANRGGYNQLVRIRKEQYQKLNGLSNEEMEEKANEIEKQIDNDLRKELSDRFNFQKNTKPKIDAEKEKIKQFLKEGTYKYFEKYNNEYFTEEMDISFRMRYIMSVREYVIKLAGGDESVFGFDEKTRERSIRFAVESYMDNRKDKTKFFKYMQENGYIRKRKAQSGTDIPQGEGYWKFSRIVEYPEGRKEYAGNYYICSITGSNGSYTYTDRITESTSCNYVCGHDCNGEFISFKLSHSVPKDSYVGGETVNIDVKGALSSSSDYWCLTANASISVKIRYRTPEKIWPNYGTDNYFKAIDGTDTVVGLAGNGLTNDHHKRQSYEFDTTVSGQISAGDAPGDTAYILFDIGTANAYSYVAYEYVWTVNE